MKAPFKLIFFYLLAAGSVYAQHDHASEAWMRPIEQLFAGLNKGDSALVRAAFTADATLLTIVKDAQGNPQVSRTPLATFLRAIASPHAEPWSEPIWNLSANHHGNFAQVWAEYAFFVGKRFSHCGVDAFQLVQDKTGQWKILHIADTREKEGCVIPDFVSSQFK
jgi:hypothetical protein